MMSRPNTISTTDHRLGEVLQLIQTSFAYMDGRIDPPSSMHHLSEGALLQQCQMGEIWVIGDPVAACVFLTPKSDHLYLGKLAVAKESRGLGLARVMVDLACDRARALGFNWVELQSRIELVENHAAFARMGFIQTGVTSHPGYDRPTSLTMRHMVSCETT
ncbi:GNAT family N-acetyltransferase [Aliisedimentitalea scapharcae]|uniref:GNAT family N-acetyltransferase n=1 Tax=Aliisedimentitalea scapharcae TaxID=1524259 RepID=A0ABZ2XRL3_9RHOB